MDLTQKKCVPCERGTLPFNNKQIQEYLAQLKTSWDVVEENPSIEQDRFRARKIKRQFKFKNFRESMDFVNKVAEIAEQEGHHPDIYIFYNKVVMELWTHAIHGLSLNDFIIARKIEELE